MPSDDENKTKMSRREFLKILGYGTVFTGMGIVLGGLINNRSISSDNKGTILQTNSAFADTLGSWALGQATLCTAIHAGLLPNGKVLYLAGSGENYIFASGPFAAGLWDTNTNLQSALTMPEDNVCCGNCMLPSGNILIAGGNLAYAILSPNHRIWGLSSAYEFDFRASSFVKASSMKHGRWYPTLVTLPNGTVITVSGFDEFGCVNSLAEIYSPGTKSFSPIYDPSSSLTYCVGSCTTLPGAGSPCYGSTNKGVVPFMPLYPRMHLMPSGLVAVAGPSADLRTWNPKTGEWKTAGQTSFKGMRMSGTTVLLPLQNTSAETGKILIVGGSTSFGSGATNSCEILTPNGTDLNSQSIKSMTNARTFHNAVILPNGSIVVNGGSNDQGAVYAAEMFDPVTQTWTVLPSATVARYYHSVALLLPDGRVWTAGSTPKPPSELRTEIYSPTYVSMSRPTIDVSAGQPKVIGGYGGTIKISTPDAPNITSVSLVRLSTVTHHYNTDQRLIWLQIRNSDSSSVTVSAPINPVLAPPGYYLIHVITSTGIPSVGQFIKIPN